MAVFDVESQKLVVRVVYDGAAFAGKTTNIRALCGHFTARRRSELFGAEELDGRTLFFDWVQIEAGIAGGFPLRCQLISVPGQAVLSARRRHLISEADVVVFVADSAPASLEDSRAALATLLDIAPRTEDAVPILVQANKQDAPDSLGLPQLLEALGLPEDTPVVAARADAGVGVVETLVVAIRQAVDRVVGSAHDRIEVRSPDAPERLLEQLRAYEVDEEALLQLLSFDEPNAVPIAPPPEPDATIADAPAAATARPPEPAAVVSGPVDELALAATLEPIRPSEPLAPRAVTELPPLPTADVATGLIWPAFGREVLRAIDTSELVVRDDLVARHGAADGSGKSDVIICQAGRYCLKTSLRRRHREAEHARADLIQLARAKMRLGEFLLPGTVLAVESEPDAHWLWTVTPWVTTLRAAMSGAIATGDEEELARALERFAAAAIESVWLAARQQVVLDVHPSNYAEVGGRLRYIDDDVGVGRALPAIGHALLRRAEEYARFPAALRRFGEAIVERAGRQLDAVERAGLVEIVRDVIVRAPAAETLRARITSALSVDLADAPRAVG